jgi:hypothetical protein
MQIFELTQSKKTLKEYDPSRPPPKKNFGAGVGPGVQPQYTATPKMKGTPQPGPVPQLPAPTTATGAVTTTAPAPRLQTVAAPAQLSGPAAAKQLGTNYDPNVIDVDAKVKPNASALPAPATGANYGTGVGPGVKPQLTATPTAQTPAATTPTTPTTPSPRRATQAMQSYQDTAAASEPVAATAPVEPEVEPAPSTPGVKGSRLGAAIGALGNRLAAHNAASVGLSVPDTGDANPYGDQRAAAAKVSAPLISQMAREELAKWNKAVANSVDQAGIKVDPKMRKQNPTAGIGQLPQASRNALELSLMNQVYTNFLQNKLGKNYRQLPKAVEPEAEQEAAAQIAKLDNAIKAILNFDAPLSDQATQLQRWQDLAQSTYDMRSLLQFYAQSRQMMPDITNTADGSYYIGDHKLNATNPAENRLSNIIQGQIKNGQLPDIFGNPSGTYQIGDYEFAADDTPAATRLKQIIKSQQPGAKAPTARSQQAPAAQQTTTAQQPSDVVQGLISLGYAPQQAAAMAAKVPPGTNTQDAIKLALAGKLNESLTWSRGFDPSRTLLKKIRQL